MLHAALEHLNDEGIVALGQQFWALLLDIERWVVERRKERCLPGSLQTENMLFSEEDIKNSKAAEKIKGSWSQTSMLCFQETHSYFPTFPG